MKTKRTKSFHKWTALMAAITAPILFNNAVAGTIIGAFPQMNGGFESEPAGTVPTLSSIATNTASATWTIQNTSTASGAGPGISATGGRSGPYYLTNFSCSTSGGRRLQSPTAAPGAVTASTAYIIQFYYRTPAAANATNFAPGLSTSGTGLPNYIGTTNLPGTGGAWVKWVSTNDITQGVVVGPQAQGICNIRFNNVDNVPIDVDDFCTYAATGPDLTPPDPVTNPSVVNASLSALNIAWTAPATGVDGGGYLVVRSQTGDPTAVPNVNGIYAVGNTVNDGVGAPGTVAYIGVNPSFVDSGLAANTAYFYRIYTVDKAFNYSSAATISGSTTATAAAPANLSISPSSVTTNVGNTVVFLSTLGWGDAPLTYLWYYETAAGTNLVATTTNLTLNNVLDGNSGGYQLVVTNVSGAVTSSVATLTVTGDPTITVQPHSAHGLLDGTVQFSVSVLGTSPTYQWYFADSSSNQLGAVIDGTQSSGSVVSGANSSVLTFTNLQSGDPTNLFVIVTGSFGSVTSSVVSLLDVTNQATLAFWDFNGPEFTNTALNPTCLLNPTPFIGAGTASAVGSCLNPPTSPFSGSVDPNDGLGVTTHLPPLSWGTSSYPASGGNKQNGVQFNVSTVGAKNIKISYESRVSATASDYERLQFTTNGTTWIDYPASSSFNSIGTTYLPYSYDLSGFPGVENNPDFGFRVVTEFQSTATYGINTTNSYLGTANTYGTTGTVTYDLVTVSGDAITNADVPPVISSFTDTNVPDFTNIVLNFTVTPGTTPVDQLTFAATSLNPSKISPTFTFGGSGTSRTLKIVPNNPIPDQVDAAPILVTVTDASGDSAAAWFTLTVTSINLAPTNSLTKAPGATNTLPNHSVVIPFTVGDDRSSVGALSYTLASDNNTLIPSGSLFVGNQGTSNPMLVIPPATNLGVALITVTVNDNDSVEPRSTPANIAVMVRPNTNVVAIDYFSYDNSGALDSISAGFWQHLSGVFGQMKVSAGSATVDTLDNTENLQTALLGSPYRTNSQASLYASYIVNMDTVKLPQANGTYFTMFNDGSGNTADVEGCVVAATNGAALGFYRLGIANVVGATALNAQMFPLDLTPGSNYVVVMSLTLSNGFSTLWINPLSSNSPSVMDTTPAATATNLYNMTQFELRESGANGGSINVSRLKVGATFDSVFPSLSVQPAGNNVIVNWSDPTLGIQATPDLLTPFADVPGVIPPITNSIIGTNQMFYRFKP